MNIEILTDSIKKHEGYRSRVYEDTLGYETIGYGFAIKDLELDEAVSSLILEKKVMKLIMRCNNAFSWLKKLPVEAQMVIVEMCYQLGVSGVSKFVKTIKHLKEKSWRSAAAEMLSSRWAVQTPNRAQELSEIIGGLE